MEGASSTSIGDREHRRFGPERRYTVFCHLTRETDVILNAGKGQRHGFRFYILEFSMTGVGN